MEWMVENIGHKKQKNGKHEDTKGKLCHKCFANVVVGKIDKGNIVNKQKQRKPMASENICCNHCKTNGATIDQVVWDEKNFNRKGCDKATKRYPQIGGKVT